MSTIRVGNDIPIQWAEFANVGEGTTVRAYWKLGEGDANLIGEIDNSYETAVDANADGNNRHADTIVATEAMIGEGLIIIIRDLTEDDIEAEATEEPHTICTDVATSVIIAPASARIAIGRAKQFTANFYAADNLPTTNHAEPLWGTSASGGTQGGINPATGLFTAGSAVGGPYAISVTAGAVVDDASVTVVETSGIKVPVITANHNVGVFS